MERSEELRNRSAEEEVMAAFRARRWEPEREASHWALAVVVVAGVLGLAGWGLMRMDPSADGVAGDPPAGVEAIEERVARTVTIDPVESPVTAPVRESAPGVIGIYECRQDGQKILSDRPCGPDAVERLIGTIRREYLDRVVFWNAVDLERKLETFRDYYNGHRVHRAIAGLTPAQRAGALSPAPAALDHHGWQQHCRGLFEIPVAA